MRKYCSELLYLFDGSNPHLQGEKGISRSGKKISHVFKKISHVFKKNSDVFQKISNVFWRKSHVFDGNMRRRYKH